MHVFANTTPSISFTEWTILIGIVLTVGTGFAIPLGVWMAKMWASQQLTQVTLAQLVSRVDRVESNDGAVHNGIWDKVATENDRINEHAERLANHEARIVSAESEIRSLRQISPHIPRPH